MHLGDRLLRLVVALCVAVLLAPALPLPAWAAPPSQQQTSVPVYGVQGHFEVAAGSTFPEVFIGEDGTRLTVAGVNATVAQQINVLARQSPPPTVQVWGTRNFEPKASYVPDLVVSEVLPQGDQAQPAPGSSGGAAAVNAVVNFSLVNLYSTPSQSMSVVGQARAGEKCVVQGKDGSGGWLLVDCGATQGWIDRRLVNVTGSVDSVPTVNTQVSPQPPTQPLQPTPTAPPVTPPATFQGWKVSYFNSPTLSGSPVAYDDVQDINFNWGYGSPAPAVPVDYFSARFERTYSFPAGYYQFNITADDGARVFIDNELAINEWHESTGGRYNAVRYLSGVHSLRIEYLELVGTASVRFWMEYSQTPPPWQANYYEGAPDRGAQLFAQGEFGGSVQLNRNWGNSSPVPGVLPNQGWNARWVGQFDFGSGNYIFRARANGGVRVYLDGTLVIDAWSDGPHDSSNTFRGVGGGRHTVTIDYYNRYGNAYIQVFWFADSFGPNYVP